MHNKYTSEDFDEDLRSVLRRSGCKDEKIAFILDESNVLDSGFLERMNTLLANGEVPGLFEGKFEFHRIQRFYSFLVLTLFIATLPYCSNDFFPF